MITAMFKTTAFIVLCCGFLLTFLVSCENIGNKNSLLITADALSDNNPDSTLILLGQIKEPEKLISADRALYSLLITSSKLQLEMQQSDWLINYAVDYYEKHGPTDRLMQSYYYKGENYYAQGEVLRAQNYFQKALKVGKGFNENALKGRIANRMGILYMKQELYEPALIYLKEAHQLFEQQNDSIGQFQTVRDMAHIYSEKYETPDSAIIYYKKLLDFSLDVDYSDTFAALGKLYTTKEIYDTAFIFLRTSIAQTSVFNDIYPKYNMYGNLLLLTGELDSARFYLEQASQCKDIKTKAAAYYLLAQVSKYKQDYKASIDQLLKYGKLTSKFTKEQHRKSLALTEAFYNHQWEEKEALNKLELDHAKRQVSIVLFSSLTILLIASFTGLLLYFLNKRKRETQQQIIGDWKKEFTLNSLEQIEANNQLIREKEIQLAQKLAVTETKLANVQNQILNAQNLVIRYSKSEKQLLEEKMLQDLTFQQFTSMKDFRPTEFDWQELTFLINTTFKDLTGRLKKIDPKITVVDLRICYLLKINVTPSEIARLLNLSKQSISMRRKRLHEKFFHEEGTPEQFDIFIKEL